MCANVENSNDAGSVCEVGNVVEGTVSGIAKFGAFVDLPNGEKGLVHISQISEEYIREVGNCLSIGQKVNVYIMSREDGKIRLSIKEANKKLGIDQISDRNLDGVSAGSKFGNERKLNNMIEQYMKDSQSSASDIANRLERRR